MRTPMLVQTEGSKRVRWYYDEIYQTAGSYAYETEEETKRAEDHEIGMLDSGEWVALFAVASEKPDSPCACPECPGWHDTDSCGGIVIEPDEDKLREYAEWNEWLPEASKNRLDQPQPPRRG